MLRQALRPISILLWVLPACADGGDPGSDASTLGGTTMSTDGDTTESSELTSVSESDTTSGGPASSSSTSSSSDSSSTTAVTSETTSSTSTSNSSSADASSTGLVCDPGTQGCPCDEGSCEGELLCVADVCEELMTCSDDANEANDDEDTAVDLGVINDNDDNGGSAPGILDHAEDQDWFVYEGDDDIGFVVDPTREITADGDLRVCKFVECLDGIDATEMACPPGTSEATSPGGRPGCCGDSGFEMGTLNCTGTTEDSATIYIRLDQAVQQCVQYTLAYHY